MSASIMSIAEVGEGAADLDALAAAAKTPTGGIQPPPGLPDVATLGKLANELFATLPGQSLPTPAGPSLAGFGASPADAAGPFQRHATAEATPSLPASDVPSTFGTPVTPPPLDRSVIDQRAFDDLFGGSLHSTPLRVTAGPSLSGFGTSPAQFGDLLPSHAFEDSSTITVPTSATPVLGQELSAIDLKGLDPLINRADPLLPSNVEAVSSQSGSGTSKGTSDRPESLRTSGVLPGTSQSAPPQPPPATPPPPVLSHHTGLETATPNVGQLAYERIAIPFEAELKLLLSPLVTGSFDATPATNTVPDASPSLYFLNATSAPTNGISVPGAAAPKRAQSMASSAEGFDVDAVRRDFPILKETVNGRPLIWFDNAATTQKPKSVIDRLSYFYEHENSNIHRAAHELAARATDAYEDARSKVARFLGAGSTEEIIFTRGTTEAINLVAATFGQQHVGPGDEIVITNLEHHANIVPWQQLCLAKGAKLRVAPVDDCGALLLDEFGKLLNARTRLAAFTHVSNALGTITPAKAIVEMAHRVGARVLIDGAQSVSHMKVDVQDLDADFFVFSGHKLFAPTGIGVLFGKKALMDSLPTYQTGGNMIRDVTFERSEFHKSPQRFEAGTGNIADAAGLGAAIDYVERIGLNNIANYEHKLLVYATERLLQIPGLRIIGTAPEKASVISLTLKGVPSGEIGARLNTYGIAVRAGHHCAQPILRRFSQETTVRPSFAFYNTCSEIDVLIGALQDIQTEMSLTRF